MVSSGGAVTPIAGLVGEFVVKGILVAFNDGVVFKGGVL